MRSGETHAANSWHGGYGAQEVHEIPLARRRIAIGIYGLAEQLDFGVARVGEAASFGEDGIARAAAFGPARVRHYAVGAGIVAAFDDGDVGAQKIIAARDFGFESFVGVEIEAGDAAAAGFELRDQLGEFAVAGGAADQADPRSAFENFFAFLLGEAAEHADDFAVRYRFPVAQARENFLRGFFADAAGVVEDEIGLRGSGDRAIALPLEHAGNFFAVVVVHLAAEGFDEVGLPCLRLRWRSVARCLRGVSRARAEWEREKACRGALRRDLTVCGAIGQGFDADVESLTHRLIRSLARCPTQGEMGSDRAASL